MIELLTLSVIVILLSPIVVMHFVFKASSADADEWPDDWFFRPFVIVLGLLFSAVVTVTIIAQLYLAIEFLVENGYGQ